MNRKHFLRSIACTTLILSFAAGSAFAAAGGTADEAKAMTQRATAFITAKGADAAYAEFTNGASFKDRDLYVSVLDFKGNCLAHGGNAKPVGKNIWELKDVNGMEFIKMMAGVATSKNEGWSEPYVFVNPVTKSLQTKGAYVQRHGETFLLVGYYK